MATTILTGWTESSLLRPLGIQAYGFEPYRISQQENRRVHGNDERISLENIQRDSERDKYFSAEEAGVRRKLGGRSREDLRRNGIVVGTADEVVDQLRAYAAAGVQRIMLQWMELDDLEGIEALARLVMPRLA